MYFAANWSSLDNDLETLTATWEQANDVDDARYHTVEESAYIISHWCLFQGILLSFLVDDVEKVMNRSEAKRNCLALVGQSNAGKTWLVNSLADLAVHVGEISQGSGGIHLCGKDASTNA
ncbi:uncharacterized protein LOC119734044 [Patiria miniata]|uniref:Uncharacterized protein n=1 Tax=Patiria miniata TaxID=46514 RepID=A0A914AI70_PATMI|nr:uncharacterized protein LOC119734044 [Patiria miniata]